MAVQIQLRRGTEAEWTTADPILAEGEFGFETDTGLFKLGDGSTSWVTLDYAGGGGGSEGGGGHVIEDDGTPRTQRDTMNFVGDGVVVTDAGGKTVVTIAGVSNVNRLVAVCLHDGSNYPARPAEAQVVIWKGPTAPTIGGAGNAVDDADIWVDTSA
jgi:hypothetical protein